MTAVISVPWSLARLTSLAIAIRVGPPRTKEAPEVDRVYFLVSIDIEHDRWPFPPCDDFEAQYFWTPAEAMRWGELDVERRLEAEE